MAEWCVEPRSATDPSPHPTEIEHPPYPTINPWGLCKYFFSCDFTSLSWSGSVLFLPLDLAGDKMTGWKTGKQPKEEKKEKSLNKQTHARGRKIGKGGKRGGCTSREVSLFNQILAGGWFDVCNITFSDFFFSYMCGSSGGAEALSMMPNMKIKWKSKWKQIGFYRSGSLTESVNSNLKCSNNSCISIRACHDVIIFGR